MNEVIQDHWRKIVDENASFLKDKLLLEFGVKDGFSLDELVQSYENNKLDYKCFGFDSFLGLPPEANEENTKDFWHAGQFNTNMTCADLQKKYNEKTTIVEGWFNEVLNDETLSLFNDMKAGLVHVDCDIYSSAKTVLNWLVENDLLVEGTLVMYDDWGGHWYIAPADEYCCGEGLAHKEMCEENNMIFEEAYLNTIADHWKSKVFRYLGKGK